MQKTNNLAVACVLLTGSFFLPSLARAADAPAVPAELAGLVDAQTLAIGRVNVAQLSPKEWTDFAAKTLKASKLDKGSVDQSVAHVQEVEPSLQKQYEKLRAAGVTQVYVVLKPGQTLSMLLLVPEPTDPEAVRALAKELGLQTRRVGKALVAAPAAPAGSEGDIQKLLQIEAADRPELFKALARAGDGAVAFGLAVPKDQQEDRGDEASTQPTELGTELGETLTRDVESAFMSIDAPPKFGMKMTIVAKDEASADNLNHWLSDHEAQLPAELKAVVGKTMDAMHPKVVGPELNFSLDADGAQQLVDTLGPALMTARKSAMRAQSMSNMRQLMMGCLLYWNDNAGKLPPDLAALQSIFNMDDAAFELFLTNPLKPESPGQGYVYVKPEAETFDQIRDPAKRVAIFEAGEFDQGKGVAFWDGHVEFISDQGQFEALLKESKNPR